MRIRTNIAVQLALFGTVFVAACHRSAQVSARSPRAGFGEEWLAWTPQQRAEHTASFIDGATTTSYTICNAIDSSIPGGTHLPSGTLIPREECLDIQKFSKGTGWKLANDGKTVDYGVSAYTTVIDELYKHPECLVMPYDTVLEHLNDKEYVSGSELFKKLQSGQAAWGNFSGFDGMDKCYRVTQTRVAN